MIALQLSSRIQQFLCGIPLLEKAAVEKSAGVYIGEGQNIWSNVHIADLAELYILALEKATSGSYFYAENGESNLRDIATSICRKLGFDGRTISLTVDEAIEIWGPAFTPIFQKSMWLLRWSVNRL